MRGFPNFRSFGVGPRIKPLNCCPIVQNEYLYIDYYFDPDFWLFAYNTFRIIGISSKIDIKFNYTIPFSAKGSKGYYKITNLQESYDVDVGPDSQGFSQITDKEVITVNNGEYISISFNTDLIGIDADYATLDLTNNTYNQQLIASYTFELYSP
jgi:hypothetical protein